MQTDLTNRRRKVNLEAMDPETAEATGVEVGKKVGAVVDRATDEVNAILGIYGLKARLVYALVDPETGEPIEEYNRSMSSEE